MKPLRRHLPHSLRLLRASTQLQIKRLLVHARRLVPCSLVGHQHLCDNIVLQRTKLQTGQDRSAGPTPSSIIVVDVEDLESLPRTKVTRSRDELGKAVREYCLAHCGKLEAVFKTREDQRALGFHLVFRGASVKLQGSATLKSLIANLQKEVVPFLKAARTIVQTECKEYRDFYDKMKDRVDKDTFKTILTRSERKLKDVQKAMKFIADLLEDLEDLGEQQRSLLRKKFDVPASA